MKKRIILSTVLLIFFAVSTSFLSGCSKKNVIPPMNTNNDTGMSGDGTDISYPSVNSGGFNEENLPIEGTLDDDSSLAGYGNEGSAGFAGREALNQSIEQRTDQEKRLYGRCSPNLFPIFFEFDQANIRGDMTDVLIRNADYLNSQPGAHVLLEGNSDERGTSEYNLALGERRAIATRQYLVQLGVDPARIRTISFGEEKPLFLGQDEETYRMNRRVDFVLE